MYLRAFSAFEGWNGQLTILRGGLYLQGSRLGSTSRSLPALSGQHLITGTGIELDTDLTN